MSFKSGWEEFTRMSLFSNIMFDVWAKFFYSKVLARNTLSFDRQAVSIQPSTATLDLGYIKKG